MEGSVLVLGICILGTDYNLKKGAFYLEQVLHPYLEKDTFFPTCQQYPLDINFNGKQIFFKRSNNDWLLPLLSFN